MAVVCLITPGHLSTNPRLVKEADALVEAGHDVRVIAARFTEWARACDRGFSGRAWRVEETIAFGPRTELRPRVVQVTRQRLARTAVRLGIRTPAVVHAAWHPIAPDLIRAAKHVRADLYIAHYPAALPAAAIAARAHGALYGFEAEDYHLGDLPASPEHALQRRLVHAIEAQYLPGCAYVTAASPGIADAYAAAYPIPRPTVVLNVFPLSQAPPGPSPKGTAKPGPSVYWFSQTIGPDRGLECAVRAIGRAASRPHLYLRGTPARGYVELLRALAAEAGAADRVHVLPPAAPADMERLAAEYDVGFSGEPGHTKNNRLALGNKLFTYLLAGIPVVMSDVPAHQAFTAEAGQAARLFPIGDEKALASVLDDLLGNPAALAAARARAYELGQERYNWDVEQAKLLSVVDAAFPAGRRTRQQCRVCTEV